MEKGNPGWKTEIPAWNPEQPPRDAPSYFRAHHLFQQRNVQAIATILKVTLVGLLGC